MNAHVSFDPKKYQYQSDEQKVKLLSLSDHNIKQSNKTFDPNVSRGNSKDSFDNSHSKGSGKSKSSP